MSEFTTCNYCSLQDARHRAKERKMKVTIRSDAFGSWGGGQAVFIHPRDVKIEGCPKEGEPGHEYLSMWLAEVPERCCC